MLINSVFNFAFAGGQPVVSFLHSFLNYTSVSIFVYCSCCFLTKCPSCPPHRCRSCFTWTAGILQRSSSLRFLCLSTKVMYGLHKASSGWDGRFVSVCHVISVCCAICRGDPPLPTSQSDIGCCPAAPLLGPGNPQTLLWSVRCDAVLEVAVKSTLILYRGLKSSSFRSPLFGAGLCKTELRLWIEMPGRGI